MTLPDNIMATRQYRNYILYLTRDGRLFQEFTDNTKPKIQQLDIHIADTAWYIEKRGLVLFFPRAHG